MNHPAPAQIQRRFDPRIFQIYKKILRSPRDTLFTLSIAKGSRSLREIPAPENPTS